MVSFQRLYSMAASGQGDCLQDSNGSSEAGGSCILSCESHGITSTSINGRVTSLPPFMENGALTFFFLIGEELIYNVVNFCYTTVTQLYIFFSIMFHVL